MSQSAGWYTKRLPPQAMPGTRRRRKAPAHVPTAFLKDFYQRAYKRIRAYLPEDKVIVFSDGFRLGVWKDFFNKHGMINVMLDMHNYLYAMETFVPFPAKWIYRLFVGCSRMEIRAAMKHTPVIVGEWCLECRRPFYMGRKKGCTDAEVTASSERIPCGCPIAVGCLGDIGWLVLLELSNVSG